MWGSNLTADIMESKQLTLRVLLKLSQFICSAFVVYCLYYTGPHWILTLSCLLVPLFGIYLTLRSPDRKNRSTASERYYGVLESRSWLRVEIAICSTMAVVFFGFGILLLYGFLRLVDDVYFLLAGLGSVIVALLYTISGLVSAKLLRQGTVDIVLSKEAPKQMTYIGKDDPNHFSIPPISDRQDEMQQGETVKQTTESKERPTTDEDSSDTSNEDKIMADRKDVNYHVLQQRSYETQQVNQTLASECSGSRSTLLIDQQPEMNQNMIDHIRNELDRSLDNETNRGNNSNNNNRSDNYNINNVDDANIIVAMKQRTQCRYAPARISTISKSSVQKLQQRCASISSQISKRKVTPIPLFSNARGAQAQNLNANHRIEHFNTQFVATGGTQMCDRGLIDRYRGELTNDTESDAFRQISHQMLCRQHQHFANKTGGMIARRDYSIGKDGSWRHHDFDRSSDDDSTPGSPLGPVYYYRNSAPLEPKERNLDIRPEMLVVEVPDHSVHGYRRNYFYDPDRNEMDPSSSNLQQICAMRSRTYGRSGSGSQRRYSSKHDHRRGSGDIQYPSYTYTESDDEDSPSPTDYSNAARSRRKTSNSSREQESTDPSCMPTIVAAIDSGRESEIIRNSSPRRTSSRDKKMRSKGFDVMIRAQSDDEHYRTRRRTRSASFSSYEKPNDGYFVMEF